jgi:hypothetical protein
MVPETGLLLRPSGRATARRCRRRPNSSRADRLDTCIRCAALSATFDHAIYLNDHDLTSYFKHDFAGEIDEHSQTFFSCAGSLLIFHFFV